MKNNRRLALCAFSFATMLEATIAALFINALLNITSFNHMNFGNLTYYADLNFMLEISTTCLVIAFIWMILVASSPNNKTLKALAFSTPFILPVVYYWPEIASGNLYRYIFEIDAGLRIAFWIKLLAMPTFIASTSLLLLSRLKSRDLDIS